MNIIIINHYAGAPSMGMEFRPYYLAKEWMRKGHQVMIVGASYSHLRTRQPVFSGQASKETIDGLTYLWLKTNVYRGNGIKRVLSMFLFIWRLFIKMPKVLDAFRPDLIIASSTYPLDNYPARFLAEKYQAQYCYEVHDLWPLSPQELGGYSSWHPFIMLMQWAENFAYRNCDFVVSMLPNTLEHMREHGLVKEKFHYVPNGVSVSEWTSVSLPPALGQAINTLKGEGKVLVGYVGGHAISNALNNLVAAAALAAEKAPNLAFLLVGDGVEKYSLIKKTEELSLSNIHFFSPVPKQMIPELLSQMDMVYLGWHDNLLYRFGISPNKLMDYMMAGKPVVHAVNAANDLVEEAGCGCSVAPDEPEAIVEACASLANMTPEERLKIGLNGRRYITKYHDYRYLAQKFLDCASSEIAKNQA